ncbi:hypothetical protein K439DRAFT_1629902 [Ramaria rubella]|nr:hypothetical protein K439DRAFT_1629902 [Ramaria rubella]
MSFNWWQSEGTKPMPVMASRKDGDSSGYGSPSSWHIVTSESASSASSSWQKLGSSGTRTGALSPTRSTGSGIGSPSGWHSPEGPSSWQKSLATSDSVHYKLPNPLPAAVYGDGGNDSGHSSPSSWHAIEGPLSWRGPGHRTTLTKSKPTLVIAGNDSRRYIGCESPSSWQSVDATLRDKSDMNVPMPSPGDGTDSSIEPESCSNADPIVEQEGLEQIFTRRRTMLDRIRSLRESNRTNHVFPNQETVDSFQSTPPLTYQQQTSPGLSKITPRARWIISIRRVINQIRVNRGSGPVQQSTSETPIFTLPTPAIPFPTYSPLCLDGQITSRSEHVIVSGGYADVWTGSLRGDRVAIKTMRPFSSMGAPIEKDKLLKRLWREYLAWSSLSHQNILQCLGYSYDFIPRSGMEVPSLISPWMSNGTVTSYIQQNPDSDRLELVRG